MSVNLLPPTPAINQWLQAAATQLAQIGIESAKLDAEIILAHTIRKSRTYLHAHGDEPLSARHAEIADARLELRRSRTPIAYIIGHKEFYGRPFRVTPATLIPRPESETMIELLHELVPANQSLLKAPLQHLVDVGTGSGCLGISAKLEHPELEVSLIDISRHALTVAQSNATALDAQVQCMRGNLLTNYPLLANYILANLPYVDPSWQRSPETDYEPATALFAEDNGLALIYKLIQQAPLHLTPHGYLLLEADPRQHAAIVRYAKRYQLNQHTIRGFIVCLQRV